MRFYNSLLFFGQTNKSNMLKEALYCFVYEHTAVPVCQACSWQSVPAWQICDRAADRTVNCAFHFFVICLDACKQISCRAIDFYKNFYWNVLSDSVHLCCVNFLFSF